MSKVIVVLSGGLDSTVLLHHYLNLRNEVRTLSVHYGQRHKTELHYASATAQRNGVPWELADLQTLKNILPGSSQTSDNVPVPHGRYDEEVMKVTVVPNRNMILLSVAIGHAIAHGYDTVGYAAHAGDHAIYPDCRPEFVQAVGIVAQLCDWKSVTLDAPFLDMTKAEIVSRGAELKVPFEYTYSCYEGKDSHCGRCGTCVERILAFKEAGVHDPTIYLDKDYALKHA